MPRIKDQAICLRILDWSETSQIVELLTREHGKVRGLAKGSKRFAPSSIARFSGGIELMTGGQLLANHKANVDLLNITEWDLQQPFWHLRENLNTWQAGMYAVDLTSHLLADHDPHPQSYDALLDFLTATTDKQKLPTALLKFQWQMLSDAGYQPQLDHDVHTNQPLADQPTYQFDPQGGGLCNASNSDTWGVRKQTVSLLRAVSADDAFDDEGADRANKLLCSYARSILDKQLATMACVLG
ncbi:MAG TPA: DNA repair protein RecO [Phycisphaerales bacterium]|nr:DNA repair protein RecO [Phycisphaerales bacterium]HCD32512.1 DNA repair protein RecO [Phycisphaerales bacterium]|tara:strand:- start:1057 stop:1782 length:726 start_codon:yes stop_codon:yes gene_type:complete